MATIERALEHGTEPQRLPEKPPKRGLKTTAAVAALALIGGAGAAVWRPWQHDDGGSGGTKSPVAAGNRGQAVNANEDLYAQLIRNHEFADAGAAALGTDTLTFRHAEISSRLDDASGVYDITFYSPDHTRFLNVLDGPLVLPEGSSAAGKSMLDLATRTNGNPTRTFDVPGLTGGKGYSWTDKGIMMFVTGDTFIAARLGTRDPSVPIDQGGISTGLVDGSEQRLTQLLRGLEGLPS